MAVSYDRLIAKYPIYEKMLEEISKVVTMYASNDEDGGEQGLECAATWLAVFASGLMNAIEDGEHIGEVVYEAR